MASVYPTSLDDLIGSQTYVDGTTVLEAAELNNIQDAVDELQEKVGIDSSAVSTSHDYRWANEGVAQIVTNTDGAVASGTTILPIDDTIPQNTEGDEYITQAITPTNASHRLIITAVLHLSAWANDSMGVALFQDSTAGALMGSIASLNAGIAMAPIVLRHEMAAGTTSLTTFKIRAGCNSANTTTLNGYRTGRYLGGVLLSSLTIQEVKN